MAIKVGSRVRVTRGPEKGKQGLVTSECSPEQCYRVKLDGDTSFTHFYVNYGEDGDEDGEGLEEVLPLSLVDDGSLEVSLAMSGLEGRLRDAEQGINDITQLFETTRANVRETRRLLDETKAALSDRLPPFKAGQVVRILGGRASGRRVFVKAVEHAFGQWMVQVAFPGDTEPYTYPASKLEAA